MSYGLRGSSGTIVVELASIRSDGIASPSTTRRVGEVVLRQVGEQPARPSVERLGLVVGREMRDAAASGVDAAPPRRLGVDLLVRHGPHDVRAR